MHSRFRAIIFPLALGCLLLASPIITASETESLWREDFYDLSHWNDQPFDKIEKHSTYSIERIDTGYGLKAGSNASASALTADVSWDITQYPILAFRWKVSNIYEAGNASAKEGDDFPMRIYVAFTDTDPSFFDRLVRSVLEAVYGRPIPHSALTYVWGNTVQSGTIITSPYTDMVKIIAVRSGPDAVGKWVEDSVNVLEDYREAFGHTPPGPASIAIMNDSDNTGERSNSWLDYLEIRRVTR